MKRLILPAIFCLCLGNVWAQQAPQSHGIALLEKGFIRNDGQVKTFSGKVNDKVKFVYNNGCFNLELTQHGFSYELFSISREKGAIDEAGFESGDNDPDNFNTVITGSSRVDVELYQANRKPVIEASNPTGAYFNFYYSPVKTNRIEKVPAFNTVTYRNIYPGIDLVFNAPDLESGTSLHYDFIVHPGADPSLIQLKYHGDPYVNLQANGAIRLITALGYVEEGKPFSFQGNEDHEIPSSWQVINNLASFRIGGYDKLQTLVIDPTLMWATYYGGPNVEDVAKVSLDKQKKPIIAGNTVSTLNIASPGAFQTTYGGGPADLFVAKFKTTGKLDWASYFGGADKDLGYGAVADKNNNVILYGKAASDGLATTGQMIVYGSGECILVKFTPDGILQWSTYKGGAGDDHYRNARIDSKGTIYCTGYTESINHISTPGAFQTVYGGDGDCLISKFTTDGVELWTTYFGNSGSDRFHAINLDLFNHLLLEGTTGSPSGMTTPGVHQTVYGGGEEDVLLAQFDTSGFRIWSTYYGGEYSDRGRGVESDLQGNIYIGGLTESETGIATAGAHQEHWTPGFINGVRQEDGYVARFTPTGQLVWGTYYGGGGYDRIWGMAVDRNLNAIFVAGGTQSDDSIATPKAWMTERVNGSTEGFFARWDYDGQLVWGSYWGGLSEDHLQDIEPDGDGFVYVLGVTNQNRMPVTLNVYQTTTSGSDEAMLDRFYAGTECFDYNEPNNSLSAGKQVIGWAPLDSFYYGYNGSIVNGMDQDWFKIKIKSSLNNFMIILKDKPAAYNLKLYNAQQQLLQSAQNPPSLNDTIVFNNAPAAYYYIRISHGKNVFDSISCYRMIIYQSSSVFDLSPGIEKNQAGENAISELTIFPNPVTEQLSFSINTLAEEHGTLFIYDMLGRLCYSNDLMLDEGYQIMHVPVAELPAGSYRLLLKSHQATRVSSFIKTGN
ncbi:MAG: hypothetical protein K1X61_00250 [Chitinophagales bacterium]|nr:hypothetical protein [Chitinophagales bacterium]